MSDKDNIYLWLFCEAAGHKEHCGSWPEHRRLLDRHISMLVEQLKMIPDSMAIGKTVQQARETGQQSIYGISWEEVKKHSGTTVSYSPLDIHEVHWNQDPVDRKFYTADPLIRAKDVRHIEDVRAQTAVAYKGICRAHVFVDGIADVWNEWK